MHAGETYPVRAWITSANAAAKEPKSRYAEVVNHRESRFSIIHWALNSSSGRAWSMWL